MSDVRRITCSALRVVCLLGAAAAVVASASAPTAPSASARSSRATPVEGRRCRWGSASSHFDRRSCAGEVGVPRSAFGARDVVARLRGGDLDESDGDSDEYDDDDYDSSDEEYSDSEDDAVSESESESETESESEEDEYDSDSEYDEESSDDDGGVVAASSSTGRSGRAARGASAPSAAVEEVVYDEMLVQGPFESMGPTLGIMLLSKRLDLTDPKIIRMARFAFVAYLVITQLFLAYVRIKAKQIDDRTPITVSSAFSSVLKSQLGGDDDGASGGGGANDMVKNLASSFLSSETSVVEYDLKQAKSMGTNLLMPMIFLWFMHFKMGQTQPLLMQTASGLLGLVYSPLFQVYVLGKNLERPFKPKGQMPLGDEAEEGAAAEGAEENGEGDVETDDSEEADDSEEDETDDSDSYDSDEYDSDEE